jgi:hypothetical protein
MPNERILSADQIRPAGEAQRRRNEKDPERKHPEKEKKEKKAVSCGVGLHTAAARVARRHAHAHARPPGPLCPRADRTFRPRGARDVFSRGGDGGGGEIIGWAHATSWLAPSGGCGSFPAAGNRPRQRARRFAAVRAAAPRPCRHIFDRPMRCRCCLSLCTSRSIVVVALCPPFLSLFCCVFHLRPLKSNPARYAIRLAS